MTDTPRKRPRLTLKAFWFIFRETIREWNDDKVPRLGAALAFYSMLSIGPLLLIVIAMAGLAFGRDAVSGYIFDEIRGLIGDQGASAIQTMLASTSNPKANYIASLIGFVTLIVSATSFFAQLQDALNTIWNVDEKENGHWTWFIQKRLLSFVMIIGIGFLLLIALVISAALSAISAFFAGFIPITFMLHAVNLVISFSVITVLFAMIFKVLPDVHIQWRDVWIGAAITAILFTLGKFLIGIYLGQSAFSSAYGAAGSLIVVLIWIYYSTQIFFLGAEFTQVYSRYMGAQIVIKKGRRKVPAHLTTDIATLGSGTSDVVNIAKKTGTPPTSRPEL